MFALFKSNPVREAAERAYECVVAAARRPEFFREGGVPDTVDGRFELICLHAFMVLHRLKGESAATEFAQTFFDTMFADFDRSLREMGTGDLSVGKHIRRMVEAFYGRIAAYEAGLAAADDGALVAALRRNVFGTAGDVEQPCVLRLAQYVRQETSRLELAQPKMLVRGDVRFGPPPARTAEAAA